MLDPSVADRNDAFGLKRDILIMRDKHCRLVVFLIGIAEKLNDFLAVFRVQVTCRFVREKDRRRVDQRTADRDTLLLTAGKLIRESVSFFGKPQKLQKLIES